MVHRQSERVARWWRQRSPEGRTRRENTLKALYQVLERREFKGDDVSFRELAEQRRETEGEARPLARELVRHRLATSDDAREAVYLTPAGWQRACEIVRNHRVWELYLTNAVHFAADHVHDDAENVEHVLGEKTVREIEKRLNYATHDPHGKLIPSLADLSPDPASARRSGRATGYGVNP